MRHAIARHLTIIAMCLLLFTLIGNATAQDVPELEGVASFSDDEWTLNINHPEDWVTFSDEEALYLASNQNALDTIVVGNGTLSGRTTAGFIIYAPGTAATLDLSEDASGAEALTAFLEREGLQSPSGEVYEGDPAVSFNVFPLQADGNIDFGVPLIGDASVDAFALEREDTFVFALLISRGDVFALSEAMWDTLTLTRSDAVPEGEETSAGGDFVLPVEDEGTEYAFTVTLPEGWQSFLDEDTGTLYLASSSAAIEVATGESDEFERGDSSLVVVMPPGLRALDINPLDSPELIFTAYAATLGIEAYPSFPEGFDVFTAQGYLAGDNLPGGQANLYVFGFPAGAVSVMVQDVLGASNPDVGDVLRSIWYDLPE